MTPTVMESGTIAEIDGWPCAMNMPTRSGRRLGSCKTFGNSFPKVAAPKERVRRPFCFVRKKRVHTSQGGAPL